MQEGGPGLGRMLRRGAGQRPKRRERVLRGCRRAVGGAPPALSPWHHRLPQMCPERRKSSTNSAFAGFCPPAALSRPVPREIPARLLQRFNLLRAGSECADYFLPLTSPLPSLVKGLFCMRSESLGFPQWQNWDWNPSLRLSVPPPSSLLPALGELMCSLPEAGFLEKSGNCFLDRRGRSWVGRLGWRKVVTCTQGG